MSAPDTHRGWLIEQNWLGEWEATHPDFDPTPVHLYDGPSDNRHVTAKTRDGVVEEIDLWIEENGEPEPDYHDCANCYGNGCLSCGNKGRVESRSHREAREDHEDRRADAIRKGEW